jgi:hypothetical protein
MNAIVPVVTAAEAQNVEQSLAQLVARLATDPEWNGGQYYDAGGAKTTLTELRVEMLKRNGGGARLSLPGPRVALRPRFASGPSTGQGGGVQIRWSVRNTPNGHLFCANSWSS